MLVDRGIELQQRLGDIVVGQRLIDEALAGAVDDHRMRQAPDRREIAARQRLAVVGFARQRVRRTPPGIAHVGQISTECHRHAQPIAFVGRWTLRMRQLTAQELRVEVFVPLEAAARQHDPTPRHDLDRLAVVLGLDTHNPSPARDQATNACAQERLDPALEHRRQQMPDQRRAEADNAHFEPLLHQLHGCVQRIGVQPVLA